MVPRFVSHGMGHKHKSKSANLPQRVSPRDMAWNGDSYDDFERRNEVLKYRIAPDCKVHLQFSGIATQDAIRKLIAYLQMSIDDFPLNSEAPSTRDEDNRERLG